MVPALLLVFSLVGCEYIKSMRDTGERFDDTDVEADADSDSDSDTDTDSDSDGDTDLQLDCDESFSTASPGGPACLTDALSCGDTIDGTTEGGSDHFDADFFQHAFCFVPFEDYDGRERAYELVIPSDTVATITGDFSCSDMGLAVVRWETESSCPTSDNSILECEGKEVSGGVSLRVETFSEARYLVVVDEPAGDEANFALQVACQDRQ